MDNASVQVCREELALRKKLFLSRILQTATLIFGAGMSHFVLADTFALPPPGDDIVGQPTAVLVQPGDTLLDIARNHDLGYNEIEEANPGVDAWNPKVGTRIILPTQFILPRAPRKGIVLNVAEMRLYYYPQPKPGQTPMVITHPVGIGREGWTTPLGETKVVAKQANPTWTVPASILKEHAAQGDPLPRVVRPGPDNPLGLFALPLAIPGYLIHGTNKPFGIGRRISHGCIQLYPEDIARLFKDVPVGTPVRIVNQPFKAGWLNGELYLESHEPLTEQQKKMAGNMTPIVSAVLDAVKDKQKVDWDKVTEVSTDHVGVPIPITPGTPDVQQVLASIPTTEDRFSKREAEYAQDNAKLFPALADLEGKWALQVGRLEEQESEANKIAAMLRHLGPPVPALVQQVDGAYRILAGPFENRKTAVVIGKQIHFALEYQTRLLHPNSHVAEAKKRKF